MGSRRSTSSATYVILSYLKYFRLLPDTAHVAENSAGRYRLSTILAKRRFFDLFDR